MVVENILASIDTELSDLREKNIVLILDFDGTLTRVRRDFEKVRLSRKMLASLKRLSGLDDVKIIVLTGRTYDFIRDRIPIHNMDVIPERGIFLSEDYKKNREMIDSELTKIREIIEPLTQEYGARIEVKEASIVFHVRCVPREDKDIALNEVVKKTGRVLDEGDNLLKTVFGRMTVEFLPLNLPDKGETVSNIMRKYGPTHFFIYIGDDTTDEPAFEKVGNNGFAVLVKSKEKDYRNTLAKYSLNGVTEVRNFLDKLYSIKNR